MSHDPPRLGDLLGEAARGFGLDDGRAAGRIWRTWREVVGQEMAAHVEPSSLRNGTLRLRTDSPIWATEVGYLAEDIRSRVNEAVGHEVVTKITVFSGPRPGRVKGPPGGRRDPPPDAPAEPDDVGDLDPREALERARRAWQARGRKTAL